MSIRTVNAAQAVVFLNELLALDARWLSRIILPRVVCSDAIANHDTVQAVNVPIYGNMAGVLGLLNGMFGTFPSGPLAGYGPISIEVDDKGRIVRFFCTEAPPQNTEYPGAHAA